jgi:putative restriction endonuclease
LPESLEQLDLAVRLAALAFVHDLPTEGPEETVTHDLLRKGFIFRGRPVHLMGPQGIFKPAVLPEMPLTIMTSPQDPYGDEIDADGTLHYRYMGNDPMHPVNIGLRKAMLRRVPLIYFRGTIKGRYRVEKPVYVVGDDPAGLTFQVSIDDYAILQEDPLFQRGEAAELRRAYVTVEARQRLHQAKFRDRVLRAYREICAICRLRHRVLLDATHILPDKHPKGEPLVSNGLSLCKLHHAAYDRNILGIHPSLRIEVREDILEEVDGPMLEHGLQSCQDQPLLVPRRREDQPNKDYLAERYNQFRRAS